MGEVREDKIWPYHKPFREGSRRVAPAGKGPHAIAIKAKGENQKAKGQNQKTKGKRRQGARGKGQGARGGKRRKPKGENQKPKGENQKPKGENQKPKGENQKSKGNRRKPKDKRLMERLKIAPNNPVKKTDPLFIPLLYFVKELNDLRRSEAHILQEECFPFFLVIIVS